MFRFEASWIEKNILNDSARAIVLIQSRAQLRALRLGRSMTRAEQERRDRALRASRIEIKIDRITQKSGDISQKQLDFSFFLSLGGICLMGKKR